MTGRRTLRLKKGTAVAFQGELGAFSQKACEKILGRGFRPMPCETFDDVFDMVRRRKAGLAVIPIENSLAGGIHQNFDLLAKHPLEAVAETYVRIEHNLIAHRGVGIRDLRQIYSHPVALVQCQKFLRSLSKIEKVPFYDTAGSVMHIKEQGLRSAGAIASAAAAKMYGLHILKSGIEDNRENYTRFLALARKGKFPRGGAKTSIVFGLRNEPGALFNALSVFALRHIDLSRIESRPIHGKPWEYLFYLDLVSDSRSRICANALRHLQEMTLYFKVLGSYQTF